VKITGATLTRIRLQLRAPIQTGRGRLAVREGAVLALSTVSDGVGYGEALPLEGFGAESITQACETLEKLTRSMIGRDPRDLDSLLDEAESIAPDAPAARAALDAALFDLVARAGKTRVAALLAAPQEARARVVVSALLRGEQPEDAAREAGQAVREGFRTVKLKVGAGDLALDEARVAAVREAIGAEAKIRIDANGAWKESEAAKAIARFAPHAIEFCEQPVAASDLAGLARLRADSPIAIAADEALAGGRALDEIQLAAALPGSLPDAGLSTGGAFVEDLAPAPLPARGEIALPEASGIGVTPLPAALEALALGPATEICG